MCSDVITLKRTNNRIKELGDRISVKVLFFPYKMDSIPNISEYSKSIWKMIAPFGLRILFATKRINAQYVHVKKTRYFKFELC